MSASVFEDVGLVAMVNRGKFLIQSILSWRLLKPILTAKSTSVLGKLFLERPETIGILVWPYQCSTWSLDARLRHLIDHCTLVEKIGKPVDFGARDKIILADLRCLKDDFYIVLDQPKWFMREGNLVVNLFVGRVRMYSLAFSLSCDGGSLMAVVGAMQGRDIADVLDEYRDLTKIANGMRPRDLLFEIFRMLCSELGVKKLIAVSDQSRHHRHRYFGRDNGKKFSTNYDEIWEDRGGRRINADFYSLSVEAGRRNFEEIPAKKRSMYRRRYEMLGAIANQLTQRCKEAVYEPHESFDL